MKKPRCPTRKTAVALSYDGDNAPRVMAKGHDALAEEIIALARAHDIPLQSDDQLAVLLAKIPLEEEIPRELYLAVAEVLAFAYWITGRVPPGWTPEGPERKE